jgi:hypothetical protein
LAWFPSLRPHPRRPEAARGVGLDDEVFGDELSKVALPNHQLTKQKGLAEEFSQAKVPYVLGCTC